MATQIADKKNRLTRACDTCRRRKVKCDQEAVPGVSCQRCLAASVPCTWNDEVKKRGRKRRVDALSTRLHNLEKALAQSMTTNPSPNPASSDSSTLVEDEGPSPDGSDDDEEDSEVLLLAERVRQMEVGTGGKFTIGESSGHRLIHHVMNLGNATDQEKESINWHPDPWEEAEALKWTMQPPTYSFPPADLLTVLVDSFFLNINPYAPILHRSTFDSLVRTNTHVYDPAFAKCLLLVCANGARFVDDPRVRLPGAPHRSAGWAWYTQTEMTRPDLLAPPTLHRVQAYILAVLYLGGLFNVRGTWMLMNTALRFMLELGVHRQKVYRSTPRPEDELWKRCFWVAMHHEIAIASETGRPCFLSEEHFDVALPLECDDEYWAVRDGLPAFQQPADRPSYMAYFIHSVKLRKIHLRSMRTLFAVGLDFNSRKDALIEIESSLNQWQEEIPTHLKWPNAQQARETNELFFLQAARLRLEYSHFVVVIHRPFIRLRKQTTDSSASFAMCTHAARATSNVCALLRDHLGIHPLLLAVMCSYNAAIILLLNLLGAKDMEVRIDSQSILRDIDKCLGVFFTSSPLTRNASPFMKRLLALAQHAGVSLRTPSQCAPQHQAVMAQEIPVTHELHPPPLPHVPATWGAMNSYNYLMSTPPNVNFPQNPTFPPAFPPEQPGLSSAVGGDGLCSNAPFGNIFLPGSVDNIDAEAEWANALLMELSRASGQNNDPVFDFSQAGFPAFQN